MKKFSNELTKAKFQILQTTKLREEKNKVFEREFKKKLENYLKDYQNLNNRTNYSFLYLLLTCCWDGSINNSTESQRNSPLEEEKGILAIRFIKYINNLKLDFQKLNIDLQTIKSLKESLLEFKKEINMINFNDRGVLSLEHVSDKFLKFLDEAIERKQAKYLLSITSNFVKHEGRDVHKNEDIFTFSKNTPFQFLLVDDVLEYLGVSKGIFSDIFRGAIKIPRDGGIISFGYRENVEKPNNTPKQAKRVSRKKLIC